MFECGCLGAAHTVTQGCWLIQKFFFLYWNYLKKRGEIFNSIVDECAEIIPFESNQRLRMKIQKQEL
jgi:hypothetical protein